MADPCDWLRHVVERVQWELCTLRGMDIQNVQWEVIITP